MLDELQRLVDNPVESLEVELKSSLDLKDDRQRASLARHIAALANHGGGVVVFGFNDDFSPCDPSTVLPLDRDTVSSIVKKYLEPAFQCDVRLVRSGRGQDHSVIVVPPHGAAPICAKAGGPEDRGKAIGIVKGSYYIRKVGPSSEAISSATEWAPLIRRCTIHDRQALFAALHGALAPTQPPQEDKATLWHEATQQAALNAVSGLGEKSPYRTGWKQFTYVITPEGHLPESSFLRLLAEVNNEVHDRVNTGWSMFFPFGAPGGEYWQTDAASGEGEGDFVECSLGKDPKMLGRDFWRISPSGKASLLREYWEDSSFHQEKGIPSGSLFDVDLFAQNVAEIVRHAQALGARIEHAESVSFICEVTGLAGRRGGTYRGYVRSFGAEAQADRRKVSASFPLAALVDDWPEVVERLATPVARIFQAEQLTTAKAIRASAERWLRF